jgi:hypothetical protein
MLVAMAPDSFTHRHGTLAAAITVTDTGWTAKGTYTLSSTELCNLGQGCYLPLTL